MLRRICVRFVEGATVKMRMRGLDVRKPRIIGFLYNKLEPEAL